MDIERTPGTRPEHQAPAREPRATGSHTGNAELAFQRDVIDHYLARAGMLHADTPLAVAKRR